MASFGERHQVLTFSQARACVVEHALRAAALAPAVEQLPLAQASGRFLAETITADRNFPPFARATRDGFALRSADLATLPCTLEVGGELAAGQAMPAGFELKSGQCVEIMTGAPVPNGADAVVMVEYSKRAGSSVEILRGAKAGENIVPEGSEARAGDRLLPISKRLDHAAIAVAASVGKSTLHVFRRPRVAVISTGDEIVPVGAKPGPNQIRNSNGASLAAQIERYGGEAVTLPIAPDRLERLRELIGEGLNTDLLVLSGGVSMGKHDLVEQVLAEFKAEFFFTGALIQPGKPVVFGKASREKKQTYFLGLPGNPVSTMVTALLFVRPMIDGLSGGAPSPLRFARASLQESFRTKGGLTRFLPAELSGGPEQPQVRRLPWQGSGDIFSAARANCYLVVLPEQEEFASGQEVPVLLP